MTLHPIVALFLVFWIGFIAKAMIGGILSHGSGVTVDLIAPTGMIGFAVAMIVTFFTLGVRRTKRNLEELLHVHATHNS